MKLFLLIILLLFFIMLGVFVYMKYYYKHLIFKDMVYICKMLKNNISFNKNTIDNLLQSAEKNISHFTKGIIEQKDADKKLFVLTKEEMIVINTFIKSLGYGDVKYELNNITYYENEFEVQKVASKELLNKDGKMYLKLIIGVGLAIFIILI